MKKRKIVADAEGRPMMVLRPDQPAIVLKLAKRALAKGDQARFLRVPQRAEKRGVQYTFAGYLGESRAGETAGVVVDERGRELGPVQPGDSFVTQAKEARS